jgi:hypothetical protein
VRIDASRLAASAAPVVERARAISGRAHPEYQDLALARLAPDRHNGPFYRFDDKPHEANRTTWRKLAEGANMDPLVDPDTLEHLARPGLRQLSGRRPRVLS